MILKDVFYTEIELEKGDFNEFVDKGWYALNMHIAYPDEEIGGNGFLDWARDLCWIEQKHVVIVIKGKVNDDTLKEIEFLDDFWERRFYELGTDLEEEKQVDFIIVNNN